MTDTLLPLAGVVAVILAAALVYALLRGNRMVNNAPRRESILIDETSGDLCRWCAEDIWPVHQGAEWVDDQSSTTCRTGEHTGRTHDPLGRDSEGRRAGEPA